jgi:LuxR family maltose regulon positive regulatory protein
MNEKQNGFLNSKYSPAVLPEVYAPRHELLSLFHKAAARHFVYVGAPAGSGKTVSALLWLNASGRKSVWIGLNEYDNAPAVFYKQLATGIFSLQPDNEGMRGLLTDPNFSATPVEHTIKLITEMRPDNTLCAVVLDDVHLITNGLSQPWRPGRAAVVFWNRTTRILYSLYSKLIAKRQSS